MLRDLFSLFPAYAGVILWANRLIAGTKTFPRTCGGDPHKPVYSMAYTPQLSTVLSM